MPQFTHDKVTFPFPATLGLPLDYKKFQKLKKSKIEYDKSLELFDFIQAIEMYNLNLDTEILKNLLNDFD
jgi:hypothetical protein